MNNIKNKKTEIREIVYCQDDEKSFGDVFVYEPENIEEQRLGNLFIVGELQNLPRNCSYIINLLASKIKKEFYSNTKRSQEESLEAGLMAANGVLAEIARQGNGEYIGKLNMACGTYKNKKFYISQAGKFKSLLIRNKKISEIVKEEDMQPFSPDRVFNNIAGGELIENDLVVFTTQGLLNIFSQDKIRKLSSSNIDDFAEKLQEKIESEGEDLVSALIIKIESKDNENLDETPEVIIEHPAQSIKEEKVIETKKEPLPNIIRNEEVAKGSAQSTGGKDEVELNKKIEPNKDESLETVKETKKEDIKKVSLSDIIREYEKMEGQTGTEPEKEKSLESIVSKKDDNNFGDLDEKNDSILKKIKVFASKKVSKAKTPSADLQEYNIVNKNAGEDIKKSRKINLIPNKKIIAVIVIILIVGSISYYNSIKKQEAEAAKSKNYESILSDSREKMDEAELELISDSDKNAGKLFVEAKILAQKVRDEYDKFDSEANEIIIKAQQEIDRIDLVQNLESTTLIANINSSNQQKIVEISGETYVIDTIDKSISKVKKENQQIEKISQFDSNLGKILSATTFQNQEILVSDGSKIAGFNPKNNQSYILEEISEIENFGSITTYSKYVYALSPNQNQIYKLQKNGQKLEGKTDWMKSGNMQEAVSMTIDQFVYVINSNGEVRKYFIGTEFVDNSNKKFEIAQPSDPITSPEKIATVPEKKYLFILESSKNRILVFAKDTGALVKQVTGKDFVGIQDFSVDADEKNITAITSNKIFTFSVN